MGNYHENEEEGSENHCRNSGNNNNDENRQNSSSEEILVDVSPECAAVALAAGTAVGGIAKTTQVPSFLSALGFTSIGAAPGAYASWWQSTFPLIPVESLLANLQSIAIGGKRSGTVAIGVALGGSISAAHLRLFCEKIDSVDPNSVSGQALSNIVDAVKISSKATDRTRDEYQRVKEWIDSSSTKFLQSDEYRRAKEWFDKTSEEFMQSDDYQRARNWMGRSGKTLLQSKEYQRAIDWTRKTFPQTWDWIKEKV